MTPQTRFAWPIARMDRSDTREPHQPAILSWPIMLLGVLSGTLSALIFNGKQQADDWASLWISGLLVDQGKAGHLYDSDTKDFAAWSGSAWEHWVLTGTTSIAPHPFVHIPGVAWIMSGITKLMDFDTSVIILTFFSGFCVVVLESSAYYLWQKRTIPMTLAVVVTIAVWLSVPLQTSLWIGQTSPLIFAGVAYALAASTKRPLWAGIILGIVGVIKLSPLVLIILFFLFASRRKTAIVALVTTLTSAVYSFIVAGSEVFGTWIETVQSISSATIVTPGNQSIASFANYPYVRDDQSGTYDFLVVPLLNKPFVDTSLLSIILAIVFCVIIAAVAYTLVDFRFEVLTVGIFTVLTATASILWNHYLIVALLLVGGIVTMAAPLWRPWLVSLAALSCAVFYTPLAAAVGTDVNGLHVVASNIALSYGMLFGLGALVVLFIVSAVSQVIVQARLRPAGG